jgi:hypothetical protein
MNLYKLFITAFKYRLFLLFMVFGVSIQAQKIKVKKGDILVDNVKIGQIEKIKVRNDSLRENYFKIKDNSGEHVFNFKNEFVESSLFVGDKKYFFHAIEYVKEAKSAAVQDPKFYPSEKQMAEYLVKYGLLDESGVLEAGIDKYIRTKERFPSDIQKIIDEEENIRSYAKFKVDRLLSDPVFVLFDKTTAGPGSIMEGVVTKSRYNIYQGAKDPKTNEFISKTFIGYAIAEEHITSEKVGWSTNPPMDYRPNPNSRYTLVVYNTKNVPMASYVSLTYKTYQPYEVLGPVQTDLPKIERIEERISYIAKDLIEKNIL